MHGILKKYIYYSTCCMQHTTFKYGLFYRCILMQQMFYSTVIFLCHKLYWILLGAASIEVIDKTLLASVILGLDQLSKVQEPIQAIKA